MLRRLAFIVTSIVAVLIPVGSAHAAFFAGDPIDGPSPDIRSVGDLDIARDGTGAVAYVRRDAGVDHVFVSRLTGGAWSAPERVDVGLDAVGSQPVVAASDGGRLAVVFISGSTSFAVVRQAGAPGWGAPQPLSAAASDPSVDMSFNGAAYATYTVNGDILGARMDRTATAFAPLSAPLDADPAHTSGGGSGRSRVAIAADGTGVAVWGENNHVYARRMYGTTPSSAVLDLTLADLDGHAGGAADDPAVDIEDDSSFAWVVFRQQFADGAGSTSRAIGVRLRGSRTDPPVAFDGLGWGGGGVEAPEIDINGKGQGVATVGTTGGSALGSVLKADILNPARPLGGSGAPSEPVGAVAETTDRAVGYLGVADGTVHGAYYDDKTTSAAVPGPGPDTPLTNPALGPADPKAGFDAAADRTGDFAFAYVQGAPDGARSLVIASYDRLPGAFAISTSSKNWRNVNKNPLAWGTALELWGPLTYTVLIDGKPILQTQTTKATLAPAAISEGLHTWRVTATDRRGQVVTTAVKPLKVDTTPPTVSFSVKRKKRVETVTTKAADVIPPSGNAAGVKYVRIDWGDGSAFTQARTASHAYGRTGAFTIRVSATDNAGNVVVAERTIHIPKK
jgi:hypothetical protein